MQQMSYRASQGFTIVDLIVSLALATMVLSGALIMTRQAVSLTVMVNQRSEMQQNGRVAINMVARDLSLAGTRFPSAGVQAAQQRFRRGSAFRLRSIRLLYPEQQLSARPSICCDSRRWERSVHQWGPN